MVVIRRGEPARMTLQIGGRAGVIEVSYVLLWESGSFCPSLLVKLCLLSTRDALIMLEKSLRATSALTDTLAV